ncbi:MAG: hypothetical protein H7X83_00895 [Verrucomicrobia bacterium]|nr:hypothetical protein [Deltaproteobacteria bacterium]
MKKTEFETALQTTSRDLNQAAVIDAANFYVEVSRRPAGNRALFAWDDTATTRDLIERYETRQPLPLDAKSIIQSRTKLHHQALRVCMEGL